MLIALALGLLSGCAVPSALQPVTSWFQARWQQIVSQEQGTGRLRSPTDLLRPAPAPQAYQLTAADQAWIDQWLREQGLNQYGDPTDTVYTGGTPLFDEATWQAKNRFQYIVERHPSLLRELGIGQPIENANADVLPENANN